MLLLGFLFLFLQPVMALRPGLCWSTVYRFREVISTSQESKSMGSGVIKSPRDFLGFIFLLSLSLSTLSLPFPISSLSDLSLHPSPHHHSLHWPLLLPIHGLFLDLSPCCLSPPDGIPASRVIVRHSARANNSLQPCLICLTEPEWGAAATTVSLSVLFLESKLNCGGHGALHLSPV